MRTRDDAVKIRYDRMMDVFDSENVRTIGYSFNDKALFVVFNNATKYVYFNVDTGKWSYLAGSESVGSILHKLIVKNPSDFPYVRIDK